MSTLENDSGIKRRNGIIEKDTPDDPIE